MDKSLLQVELADVKAAVRSGGVEETSGGLLGSDTGMQAREADVTTLQMDNISELKMAIDELDTSQTDAQQDLVHSGSQTPQQSSSPQRMDQNNDLSGAKTVRR